MVLIRMLVKCQLICGYFCSINAVDVDEDLGTQLMVTFTLQTQFSSNASVNAEIDT